VRALRAQRARRTKRPPLGDGLHPPLQLGDQALGGRLPPLVHSEAEAALPCYHALPAELQKPIKFTQSKLGFNHGWLVQAEAPPGPLFSSFKHLIETEGVSSSDIAFYFVHWLTDLAGAVPSPLRGAEKFVVKFPRQVLSSFIGSFSLVQRLATETPTELFEDFLNLWWPAERLGAPPTGEDAIALMRLVVQVQTPVEQSLLQSAFHDLDERQRETLAAEMALSGVAGQTYRASVQRGGPAFLVYYSPAFLRGCVSINELKAALGILAEVYRAARQLFPLQPEAEGSSVTIFIDQLKAHKTAEKISAVHATGRCWLLVQKASGEAMAEETWLSELPRLIAPPSRAVLLPLWPTS